MLNRTRKPIAVKLNRAEKGAEKSAREAFLAGVVVQSVPDVAPLDAPSDGPELSISKNAHAIVLALALDPIQTVTPLYASLGMHPAKGKAAIDELVAEGYARVHRVARDGRGAQYQVVELLQAADAILAPAGLSRPDRVAKGGFKHDLFARYTAAWARRERSGSPEFEQTYGRKQFDVAWTEPDGSLWGAEVCLSGGPGRTTEQLLRALRPKGVNVMAIFETRKAMEATLKALKADPRFAALADRFETRLVGEFIRILFERA